MSKLMQRRPNEEELDYATPLAPSTSKPHSKTVMQVLWRGRWLILLSTILALLGGFIYLANATPIYASNSRLYIELSGGPRIISDGLGGSTQSSNYLQTQSALIMTPKVLSSVAESPEIRQMRTFADVDNPVGLLKANASATVSRVDDLVTVSFMSPYPADAAEVTNRIVEAYKSFNDSKKRATAAEVLKILRKEYDERDRERSTKVREMLDFKQANPDLSFLGKDGNIIIERLAKLSDALTTARLETLESKGMFQSAKAIADDPAKFDEWLQMQRNGAGTDWSVGVEQLEMELAIAKKNLMPEHESIKVLQARLDEYKERMAKHQKVNTQTYLGALEQRFLTAQMREQELQETFAEQQKRAMTLNTQQATYARLESDAQQLAKLCDALDMRIKEIKVTEDVGAMDVEVVEYARPNMVPVKPNRPTILFEVLALGLMVGGGLSFLRDWMDQRLNSIEEVQALLGVNLLGVLPHMPGKETVAVRGQKVHLDPMSDVAEAYRTVRTAVYFGAPEGKTRTLLITSPTPGDGKSTLASNLSIAMAQAGQRVLLLDADFRKPSQHRVFGIEDGIGLSNAVAREVPLGKAIKPTQTPGLYVLPCGSIPKNPSEILNSHVFAQVIKKLKEKFDHIVIDSPPVMPVTDARILGASADLTILVLRAQKSTRKISSAALDSLTSVGSRVLGVVVNDAPRGSSYYSGFGGYYGYRYGYGNSGASKKSVERQIDGARLPATTTASEE